VPILLLKTQALEAPNMPMIQSI